MIFTDIIFVSLFLMMALITIISIKTTCKLIDQQMDYQLNCLETTLKIEEMRSKQVDEWIRHSEELNNSK